MMTKMLTAIVMTGALWVAGDAAIQQFGCSFRCPFSSQGTGGCCVLATKPKAGDCCSSGSDWCTPARECCVGAKVSGSAASASCCTTAFSFCTRTGEVYEGCCCEIVNGQYRCLLTGAVSAECCCIPIE